MKTSSTRAAEAIAIACALGLSGGLAFGASATNSINLTNPTSQTTKTLAPVYSPNGSVQAAGKVTVSNGTRTADNRAYCIVFQLTNGGSQGGLVFSLLDVDKGNTLSLSGSPANVNEVLSGTFAAGTAANTKKAHNIAFRVDPATIPPPGSYVATITESIYGGSAYPPSGAVLDTNTLTVTIKVNTFYDVSVVPKGSGFSLSSTSQSLNFGNLYQGESMGADILVRSNVGYSLSLSSANKGALVNPLDATSSAAYSAASNGASLALNPGPAAIASGAAATYGSPMRYALVLTILPFASYPSAGSYSDTLTVSLASP